MSPELERRAAGSLTANGRTLTGYIATWDREAQIGSFREVVRRGAFRDSLASGADILALLDHSPTAVLGRTKSGTLELSEDDRGLAFRLSVPDTTHGRDLVALAERHDLGGASFGFEVLDEAWSGDLRELRSVRLHEVSIVSSWPAYDGTVVNLRRRPPAPESRPLYLWLETVR